jgi:hypothetical protein
MKLNFLLTNIINQNKFVVKLHHPKAAVQMKKSAFSFESIIMCHTYLRGTPLTI